MSVHLLPKRNDLRKHVAPRLAVLAFTSLLTPLLHAQTVIEVPNAVQRSADHGRALPTAASSITVHLKLHNEPELDKAIEELYRPGSATFHQWMKASDLARYAASTSEVNTVKQELESHGLTILDVDTEDSSIHARGTVSQLEGTFQTEIHEYEYDGKVFRANAKPAALTGDAGKLIKGVTGLTTVPFKSHAVTVKEPHTGKARPFIPVKAGTSPNLASLFTTTCFTGAGDIQLTTPPNSSTSPALPAASYYGNIYGAVGLPCGYTPQQIQQHYGLFAAYDAGYTGAGQTIVLVDGPSYASTVTSDLASFSAWTRLPAQTKSNFQIIYPDGQPSPIEMEEIADWTTEADLDVQWAHAIAPQAKIILLITPTQDWTEFEYAIQYAVKNHLGNVISNSYGYPEFLYGKYTVDGFEQVLKSASASGVSINFSSGDAGDEGTGAPNAGGTEYPATSAYVTAVGGTTINTLNDTGSAVDVGWGVNDSIVSFGWTFPLDPPYTGGFVYGSGGGESGYIPKPSWQSELPGSGRQSPDIAAVADPYTGAIIVYDGELGVIGGTSLASPVFSGIWALATEKAGAPLGQAAQLLHKLPGGAIRDIVPFSSPQNVSGFVVDTNGSTFYSAAELSGPLENTSTFYSALWDETGSYHEGVYDVLSFGTDSSLTVAHGWDNVTGWGMPNGYTFISDVASTVQANTVSK